jgi:hypothetical protein
MPFAVLVVDGFGLDAVRYAVPSISLTDAGANWWTMNSVTNTTTAVIAAFFAIPMLLPFKALLTFYGSA